MTLSTMPFVLAMDFRAPEPDRVWSVVQGQRGSIAELGGTYICEYRPASDPLRALVTIGFSGGQRLLDLARTRYMLEWFDAIGLDDIPAVFAGYSVDKLDIGGEPASSASSAVVAAVTPIRDITEFTEHVRASVADFRQAGIRKTLLYRAFNDEREVMFLQEMADERGARRWSRKSDVASDWLLQAGIGVYPPVFVGTLQHMMRFPEPIRGEGRP